MTALITWYIITILSSIVSGYLICETNKEVTIKDIVILSIFTILPVSPLLLCYILIEHNGNKVVFKKKEVNNDQTNWE